MEVRDLVVTIWAMTARSHVGGVMFWRNWHSEDRASWYILI